MHGKRKGFRFRWIDLLPILPLAHIHWQRFFRGWLKIGQQDVDMETTKEDLLGTDARLHLPISYLEVRVSTASRKTNLLLRNPFTSLVCRHIHIQLSSAPTLLPFLHPLLNLTPNIRSNTHLTLTRSGVVQFSTTITIVDDSPFYGGTPGGRKISRWTDKPLRIALIRLSTV